MFLVVIEDESLRKIKNVYFFRKGKKATIKEEIRKRENLPDYSFISIVNLKDKEFFRFYERGF